MPLFHRKKKEATPPPQPQQRPAWTPAAQPQAPRASTLEIGRQRPGLTAQEGAQLTTIQKSLVGRKAREINMHRTDFSLTDAQREKPEEEVASRGEVAEGVYDTASNIYGKAVSDVATPIVDSAGAAVDFAGGGKDRNWGSIGQRTDAEGQDIWGDGSMQSNGIPIGSAVKKSIGIIFATVDYVKQLVKYVKDSKDARALETGDSALSKEEKKDMFLSTVEIIQQYLDTAMSWAGAFTTALGRLPIVGAIFGAIDAGMSLVVDAVQWYKSEQFIQQMRDQKSAAKSKIRGEQGAFGRQVATGRTEERRTGIIHRETVEKFKVSRTYENTTDEGTNKARAMRLDEKTRQLRGTNAGAALTEAQEEAVRDLEDYDITKELTSANKKRRREGVTDLVFKDVVGLGAALANLDPTGMGSTVGAAVTAAVGAGYLGKSVGSYIRQKARNHGIGSADLNKSEANKKQRRHNLAVVMYDRIMELADTQVASIDDPAHVTPEQRTAINKGALQNFDKMNERINAMGVAGAFLRSHTAPEMVKVMRQGFYRDSGG